MLYDSTDPKCTDLFFAAVASYLIVDTGGTPAIVAGTSPVRVPFAIEKPG
jgi:hypothetical protein